jgi:hypothetical protein
MAPLPLSRLPRFVAFLVIAYCALADATNRPTRKYLGSTGAILRVTPMDTRIALGWDHSFEESHVIVFPLAPPGNDDGNDTLLFRLASIETVSYEITLPSLTPLQAHDMRYTRVYSDVFVWALANPRDAPQPPSNIRDPMFPRGFAPERSGDGPVLSVFDLPCEVTASRRLHPTSDTSFSSSSSSRGTTASVLIECELGRATEAILRDLDDIGQKKVAYWFGLHTRIANATLASSHEVTTAATATRGTRDNNDEYVYTLNADGTNVPVARRPDSGIQVTYAMSAMELPPPAEETPPPSEPEQQQQPPAPQEDSPVASADLNTTVISHEAPISSSSDDIDPSPRRDAPATTSSTSGTAMRPNEYTLLIVGFAVLGTVAFVVAIAILIRERRRLLRASHAGYAQAQGEMPYEDQASSEDEGSDDDDDDDAADLDEHYDDMDHNTVSARHVNEHNPFVDGRLRDAPLGPTKRSKTRARRLVRTSTVVESSSSSSDNGEN